MEGRGGERRREGGKNSMGAGKRGEKGREREKKGKKKRRDAGRESIWKKAMKVKREGGKKEK